MMRTIGSRGTVVKPSHPTSGCGLLGGVTATSRVGGETRLRLARLLRERSGSGIANVRPCG